MRILVPLDFSTATERTLVTAIRLARATHGAVTLLHVAAPEPDFVGYAAGSPAVRTQVAHEHREEHRQLQAHAQALRDLGIDATALLIQGPTAATILAEAERLGADMILMATHGRSALADLLVGGVSHAVLRGSRIPVMLVPARG
jgi:nucleotide-binding universal stress UspA family protein